MVQMTIFLTDRNEGSLPWWFWMIPSQEWGISLKGNGCTVATKTSASKYPLLSWRYQLWQLKINFARQFIRWLFWHAVIDTNICPSHSVCEEKAGYCSQIFLHCYLEVMLKQLESQRTMVSEKIFIQQYTIRRKLCNILYLKIYCQHSAKFWS